MQAIRNCRICKNPCHSHEGMIRLTDGSAIHKQCVGWLQENTHVTVKRRPNFFEALIFGGKDIVSTVPSQPHIQLLELIYDVYPGYPPDWDERRAKILRERGAVCGKCRSRSSVQLHHEIRLGAGGSNEASNLIVLCADCHEKEHRHSRVPS